MRSEQPLNRFLRLPQENRKTINAAKKEGVDLLLECRILILNLKDRGYDVNDFLKRRKALAHLLDGIPLNLDDQKTTAKMLQNIQDATQGLRVLKMYLIEGINEYYNKINEVNEMNKQFEAPAPRRK